MTKIRFVFLIAMFLPGFTARAADSIIKDDNRLDRGVVIITDVDHDVAVITDVDHASQMLGRIEEDELHCTFKKMSGESGGLNLPISIDLSNPNDINWDGVLQVNGADGGPSPVVLPFLPSIPIENFEVKYRFLNKKF